MKLKQSAWLLLLLLLPTTTTVIAQSGLWVERVRLCLLGQQKAPFWPLKASYSRNSSSKEPRIRWPNNQQNGGGGGRPLFFSSLRKFGLKQTSSHERLLKLKTEKCSVTNSMRFHSLKNGINSCALEAFILDFWKDFFRHTYRGSSKNDVNCQLIIHYYWVCIY